MSNLNRPNKHCRCCFCNHRELSESPSSTSSTSSLSSESSLSSCTKTKANNSRWFPEYLGVGAGTGTWRSRPSRSEVFEDSSIEIVDHTTFSRRCWRRNRP